MASTSIPQPRIILLTIRTECDRCGTEEHVLSMEDGQRVDEAVAQYMDMNDLDPAQHPWEVIRIQIIETGDHNGEQ